MMEDSLMVGLGTWKSPPGKTANAVIVAIQNGYRFIDTANDYGNEHEIGQALKEVLQKGIISRDQLFVQSKLWNTNHRPEHVIDDLKATLEELQLDYVDSFVIHWPQACPSAGQLTLRRDGNRPAHKDEGTMFPLEDDGHYSTDNESHFVETWLAMEELVEQGLVKHIGLSNFTRVQIEEILEIATIKPYILQNESHPFLQQKDLIDFCRINGIIFQAYSPLGSRDRPWAKANEREVLDEPLLVELSEKYGKSPAQIILRWHFQRGVATVPKSVTPSRIIDNQSIFDFELSRDDMDRFGLLNRGWRHCLWPETALHPDYPFKDELPHGYEPGLAPTSTSISSIEKKEE